MPKLNNLLMTLSFGLMVVSFFNRNEFPSSMAMLPVLNQEPLQQPIEQAAFQTTYEDEPFTIQPLYDYELYGLVVSYRLHDATGGIMLHALNKDHLNIADYCVVWGDAANPKWLREFDFSNGQFTCQFSTRSDAAWQAFNPNQLSNNHLLAIDEAVRDTIKSIDIGDQIHLRGQLASYRNPMGFERGTSTTRTDTGNGACETIWVEQITILSNMTSGWRTLLWLATGLFLLTAVVHFKLPFQPRHR